jgi:hypothetical protein
MNSTAKKIQFFENSSILIVQTIKNIFFQFLKIFMRKGFIPPAPVGNAPSQIVNCDGGPKLTAAMKKGIISLRTQAILLHLQLLQHFISSLSRYRF